MNSADLDLMVGIPVLFALCALGLWWFAPRRPSTTRRVVPAPQTWSVSTTVRTRTSPATSSSPLAPSVPPTSAPTDDSTAMLLMLAATQDASPAPVHGETHTHVDAPAPVSSDYGGGYDSGSSDCGGSFDGGSCGGGFE